MMKKVFLVYICYAEKNGLCAMVFIPSLLKLMMKTYQSVKKGDMKHSILEKPIYSRFLITVQTLSFPEAK